MDNIYLRLYLVKDDKEINVLFDTSISFNDNFSLLKDLYNYDFNDAIVYDYELKLFLDSNTKIYRYNIPSSRILFIY